MQNKYNLPDEAIETLVDIGYTLEVTEDHVIDHLTEGAKKHLSHARGQLAELRKMLFAEHPTPTNNQVAQLPEEIGSVYSVSFAWTKAGNNIFCAWCGKNEKDIADPKDHVEAHDHTQKEYEKLITQRERSVREKERKRWIEALGEVEQCSVLYDDNEIKRQQCLGKNALIGVLSIKMDFPLEALQNEQKETKGQNV